MKIFLTTLLAFCMLTAFTQIPSYVPTNGLVAWYPFNGNANDESGNGNNGTVNGATLTTDRFGNVGKAFTFNGSSNFIEVPHSSTITVQNGITMSCWFNADNSSTGLTQTLISKGVQSAYWNYGLSLTYNGIACYNYTNYSVGSLNVISSLTWHHILFSIDVNSNSMKQYIDGVLQPILYNVNTNTVLTDFQNLINSCCTAKLNFGKNSGGQAYYKGKIDDIAIYNRALSQSEITGLYNSGTNNCLPSYLPTNGLVGYWPFCGNANDESGNGNNGTVNGATLTTDRFGNAGKAYSFDGNSNYIETTPNYSSQNFTIQFWIKPGVYRTYNGQIGGVPLSTLINGPGWPNNWEFQFKYLSDSAGIGNGFNGGYLSKLFQNQWSQIVCVFDSISSTIKQYKDGILNQVVPFVYNKTSNRTIFGGRANNPVNCFFNGSLDDIAIYNRALTATEVQNLYNASAPTSCTASISQNDTTICRGATVSLTATSTSTNGVTDVDGNYYPSVNIGTQTWMQKNLSVSRYKNGDIIPQVTNATQWAALTTGAWCWYNNDSATYGATYGKLYNWYAVNDPRGLAPEGWRVPSDGDWNKLTKYLDTNSDTSYFNTVQSFIAGGKLKKFGTEYWYSPNAGAINSSQFTSLPGGYRGNSGTFNFNSYYAYYWSRSEYEPMFNAWFRTLSYLDSSLNKYKDDKYFGLSIRCLKDTTTNYQSQISNFLWSTGDTTASINVSPTQTTTYYVTLNNGTSSCTDSVTVTVNSGNFFLQDTIRYCGTSYALSAGAGYSSYLWSTGSTTSTITATTSKWYVCTVNQNGCTFTDSVYLQITNPASIPVPASITIQSIQTNVCGSRKYRYIAPALPVNATGYQWSFVGSLFNGSGTIDSGTLNSRIITVTYSSNSGCGAGDSIKLRYNTVCGFSNWRALKLSNTVLLPPNAPASITVQSVAQSNCGARRFRYIAPLLQAATASNSAATGWQWEFAGSLSEFATIDSGDENSRIIVVVFSTNAAAQSGDSIKLYYQSDCGLSKAKAMKLTNVKLNTPVTPSCYVLQAVQTNVCGVRKYRFIAPSLPAASLTSGAATGWLWSMPIGTVGSTAVLDSGTLTSKVIVLRFSSNAAAGIGDSIKLRYNSECGYSPFRTMKLINTALKPPMAPASITIQSVATNICGTRKYRYIAPALPAASATNGVATGWQWTMPIGTLGATATLDSGSLTGRIIVLQFTSNAAATIGDSIKLRYNSDCGFGPFRAMKLSNTLLSAPLAPTSITMTLVQNDCGARIYRYTAPALCLATTVNGAATGYEWSMPFGPLGSQGTLDSGTLTSRTIRIIYPSNDASQAGDSIRVRYNSICGLGLNKTLKLSNTVKTGCPPVTKPAIPYAKTAENQTKTNQLSVLLYPNPSTDQFYVKLSSESKSKVMIRIFDMQGKRVQQLEALPNGVTQIGNGLKPGTYMMQVHQDGVVQTIKLVKI